MFNVINIRIMTQWSIRFSQAFWSTAWSEASLNLPLHWFLKIYQGHLSLLNASEKRHRFSWWKSQDLSLHRDPNLSPWGQQYDRLTEPLLIEETEKHLHCFSKFIFQNRHRFLTPHMFISSVSEITRFLNWEDFCVEEAQKELFLQGEDFMADI